MWWGAAKQLQTIRKPYYDPILKVQPRKYVEFCKKLQASGLVEFHRTVYEEVGAFCVRKKNNRQRLVIDSRLANMWFEEPESVQLCTSSTFARIEVGDQGEPIQVGGVDITDAFYNIGLPPSLRKYFGLKPLKAGSLGIASCVDGPVRPGDMVHPVLRVVPMGWSHALWVCQRCHEMIIDGVPRIVQGQRIVDRQPVAGIELFVHTEYVDNFIALSQRPGIVFELATEAGQALRSRGLPTHEVEAGYGLETLGWAFDQSKPVVKVTNKRLWRLRLATLELLRQGRADGRLIEKLVGHYTFAGLLQRGLLSVFQAAYAFVRKHYCSEVELWPEVRRELFWAASLICLVGKDLGSPWSSRAHATDASFWGRGVVSIDRDIDQVKSIGQHCDRWRFNTVEEREVVRGIPQHPCQDIDVETLGGPAGGCEDAPGNPKLFPEVPLDFLRGTWTGVDGSAWQRVESIPALEGRAIVWLAQHLARSQKNFGKRRLILTDSMTMCLAISKGRSSTPSINRICRQLAALQFMTGYELRVRWIASELNPGDPPSRAQKLTTFDLDAGLAKLISDVAEKNANRNSSWRRAAAEFYSGSPADTEKDKDGTQKETKTARAACEARDISWSHCARGEKLFGIEEPDQDTATKLCPSLAKFQQLGGRALKIKTVAQLDQAMCDRINQMFFNGQDISEAQTLVAATRYHRDDVSKTSQLTRCAQALRGFNKLEPAQGRLPMPYPVLCMIVQDLWQQHRQIALWLLLTWGACARPGEAHRVLNQDIVPPTELCKHYIVVLNSGHGVALPTSGAREIRSTSKIGEADKAVLLDQPYLGQLGKLLKQLGQGRQQKDPFSPFRWRRAPSCSKQFSRSLP